MRMRQSWLVAAAIVAGALVIAGVPLASFAVLAVVLACPLMMFFMMRGMQGDGHMGESRRERTGHRDER